jgi:LysR family transcriptional regulator, glycine cleavage system transcriptional activator
MSIKKAAFELSVTPSAVSHRLRVLEMMLGHELLRRVGSQLELTKTGQALAPKLTTGFDHIFDAVNTVLRET